MFLLQYDRPNSPGIQKRETQAGAELCQAQVKLEGIVDVVEEAWS